MKVQKIVFIDGNPVYDINDKSIENEIAKKTGVWIDGQLQRRFEAFARSHKVIDWHTVQQSMSQNWFIVVRYEEDEDGNNSGGISTKRTSGF